MNKFDNLVNEVLTEVKSKNDNIKIKIEWIDVQDYQSERNNDWNVHIQLSDIVKAIEKLKTPNNYNIKISEIVSGNSIQKTTDILKFS